MKFESGRVRQKSSQLAIKQKQQEMKDAREMALAGYSIEQISSLMHRSYKAIQNYPMCRKTPCFSYGDIRHFHRIYVSN